MGDRGISICGSEVGASYAANNVTGLRTALIQKSCSVHPGVEDDGMNLLCLGGRAVGFAIVLEIVQTILQLANLRLNDLSSVWRKWLQSSARSR
jgi:ribose 5-phosphate isomerase B